MAIKLLDAVALLEDVAEPGLKRGEVGTVIEILVPDVFEAVRTNAALPDATR